MKSKPKEAEILIIEDNLSNLKVLTKVLKKSGYTVLAAEDGEMGLQRASYAQPDLILLDILLPDIDGFETCRRLKANEQTNHIPVIFLTALDDTEDKLKGFQLGAVDYITKPFEQKEVLVRIGIHLRLRQLSNHLEQLVQERTAALLETNEQLNQEITKRKQAEEQVRNHNILLEEAVQEKTQELRVAKETAETAREKAELANQAKSEFLSNMSHELRTPLNGILGYAQILKRDRSLNDRQVDGLSVIHQSGDHLLTLINDILDLSKIEAGKMDLHLTNIHLADFLKSVAGITRMRADQKDIHFVYEALSQLPHSIQADETRLRQVLINLLGNAIKFTDIGHVTLTVQVIAKKPSSATALEPHLENTLRFEITDSGIGMTPAQTDKIFLPFEQVGDTQRRAEGTGLGLSISRQLVEAMGSILQVKSVFGQGTTFWFDLTVPVIRLEPEPKLRPRQTIIGYQDAQKTILVADDKDYNRMVLLNLLEPLGFKVNTTKDGQALLTQANAHPPDLILTDLVMPEMTGFEAVRLMRQNPALQFVPMIAVSASVLDSEKSRVAGCDDFLPKPVNIETLLTMLEKYLNLHWLYAEPEAVEDYSEQQDIIPPPRETLEILLDLVKRGHMNGIEQQAKQIAEVDEVFKPFAKQLGQLAREFDDIGLEAMIEHYMAS